MKNIISKLLPLKLAKQALAKSHYLTLPKTRQEARTNAQYWTEHNVTTHTRFKSAKESFDYFNWRNSQYYNYLALMPVTGLDSKVVLDYGCGPGNDLVGIGSYSRPSKLIGMDISNSSLAEARGRLQLHSISADLYLISDSDSDYLLPIDDSSVDYIHCSGVLHHIPQPEKILKEFRRVLKPEGRARIMVYNYHSLWVHLYVAYVKKIVENQFAGVDILTAFSKTTDGVNCPFSAVYTPNEFINLCLNNGFSASFSGAAISMWEMSLLEQRFKAVMSPLLSEEHRNFLLSLTFDDKGYPLYQGHYAGVDGCYFLE